MMFLELPNHRSYVSGFRFLVEEVAVMEDVRRIESRFIDDVD